MDETGRGGRHGRETTDGRTDGRVMDEIYFRMDRGRARDDAERLDTAVTTTTNPTDGNGMWNARRILN